MPPSSPHTTGPTPSSSTRCSGSSCGASRMPEAQRARAREARRTGRSRVRRSSTSSPEARNPSACGSSTTPSLSGSARDGDASGSAGSRRPPATDERVVEIPWVLSRLRREGRVLEVGYAFAEPAYLGGLLQTGVELVGVDLATRDVEGMETVVADVRELPFQDESFDQILLVSTLEHVGADNTVYGLEAESDAESRHAALRELGRVLRRDGSLVVTVPLGEPGDHGWFRQEDEAGWTTLFAERRLLRRGDRGVRARGRRLACRTCFRRRRRALRRTRAGRVSRPVRRSRSRATPTAADSVRARNHRQAAPPTTSASHARERLELPRCTSS